MDHTIINLWMMGWKFSFQFTLIDFGSQFWFRNIPYIMQNSFQMFHQIHHLLCQYILSDSRLSPCKPLHLLKHYVDGSVSLWPTSAATIEIDMLFYTSHHIVLYYFQITKGLQISFECPKISIPIRSQSNEIYFLESTILFYKES